MKFYFKLLTLTTLILIGIERSPGISKYTGDTSSICESLQSSHIMVLDFIFPARQLACILSRSKE